MGTYNIQDVLDKIHEDGALLMARANCLVDLYQKGYREVDENDKPVAKDNVVNITSAKT